MASNLTIFNGSNSQIITITSLVDSNGSPVTTATITGQLVRSGVNLPGGSLVFVHTTNGTYKAPLVSFDSQRGGAQLQVSGSNGLVLFSYTVAVTIAVRSS